MKKDLNKDILEDIEENAFYRKSAKEEVKTYIEKENQEQRDKGIIAKNNFKTIHLEEKPDRETRKRNIKIGVWGIAAITALLVTAIIVCMKLAS